MAESSTTFEEPPIEKAGLGLMIPDTTPSDPITSDEGFEIHASENEIDDEKLRNAIEQEIYQMSFEQAEIEVGFERLEINDEEIIENENNAVEEDEVSVEEESDIIENERDDEENVEGQSKEMKVGRLNRININNLRKVNYPMRPDAEDCAYYMKFGSCKYGLNCKFNHPPNRKNQAQGVKEKVKHREENSERTWQTECKYYLTSGGCKYGNACKFFHGSEKSFTSPKIPEFNFLGLPIRLGEKECPYYMRTGSCKYGSNCRFHHPEPEPTNTTGSPLPPQLVSSSSWSSQRPFSETASRYSPVTVPTPNPEWNRYQAPYTTSEESHSRLPTPPAFALNNLPTEINFPMQQYHHHLHDMVIQEYPERPGEPECSFFLKTGDCKFKSTCKFHHPKNHITKLKTIKAKPNSSALNDKGLPLRPDQPICTNYHRYGICKYGPACKYDHPSNYTEVEER